MRSLLIVIAICFLSSCSIGGASLKLLNNIEIIKEQGTETLLSSRLEMLDSATDNEKANARLEQVIQIIEEQDKDALRALFSKNALIEAEDFDENADCLFKFIQGKIDSWEKTSGPHVSDSIDRGQKTKNVSSFYFVSTDKNKYFFLLEEITVDIKKPNNVGLYLLLVVKEEDEAKIWDGDNKILFDGRQDIPRFGVYLPFK